MNLLRELAVEHGRFGVIRRLGDIETKLARQRLGDVALAGEAELDQQRFEPLLVIGLEAQDPVERGLVELAAGDKPRGHQPLHGLTVELLDQSGVLVGIRFSRNLPCGRLDIVKKHKRDDFMSKRHGKATRRCAGTLWPNGSSSAPGRTLPEETRHS